MKYSLIVSSLIASATTVFADIYIGILAGEMSDGSVANPTLDKYQTGFVARDGESICDAPTMTIEVDFKKDAPWWNVCGEDLSGFCDGKKLSMNPKDYCGSNAKGDDPPGDGYFYADLLDNGDGDKVVGRCVFELGPQKTCFAFGSLVGEYSIRCYTDQC